MKKTEKVSILCLLCFITGSISGFLAGVAGLSMLVGHRIDKYHQEISRLETVIEDRDMRLKKLEESINKKKPVIRSIELELVLEEGDEMDRITVEKFIKQKYSGLLGKEVKDVDMEIIEQVVDKRIFRIHDRAYKLSVSKVMVSEILKIWLKVEKSG